MAKPRRGLGRGLNSLLGGQMEETSTSYNKPYSPEPERTTERYTVNKDGDDKKPEEPASAEISSIQSPFKEIESSEPVSTETQDIREPVYSNAVDNVTIKSVVERDISSTLDFNASEETSPEDKGQDDKAVDEVDINLVAPNPDQPRTNFKREELDELADSIKRDGLLQPILVRTLQDGSYQIIAGERRWQACKKIGLEKVPVRIKEVNDNQALELALIENLQRSDLNPIEEAYGYRRMMERENLTQSEVAKTVSKGRSTIANALRLLELPEDAQQLLFEEKITAGHARAILSVPTDEGKRKLTEKLINETLSVRETEAIARLLSGKKSDTKTTREPMPQSFKKVARTLRENLNRNVKIKSSKGKNKLEIEFTDEEDLAKLLSELTGGSSSEE